MASDNDYVQPTISHFDGHYDHWRMLIENFLRYKEYWSIMETSVIEAASEVALTKAQQKRLEEYKLKDLKINKKSFVSSN